MKRHQVALIFVIFSLAACATSRNEPAASIAPRSERPVFSQTGIASWYGNFHNGMPTADGERFDLHAMTAAHRDLPFNSIVRVTNLATGQTTKLRINDRGPYRGGRIIDVSAAAGARLGIKESGMARVKIELFASDQPPGRADALRQAAQP